MLEVHDVLHPTDEPRIDLSQFVDPFHRITILKSLRDGENPEVCRVLQLFVEVGEPDVLVADEAVHSLSDHSQTLLDEFLETAADGHDLADRLHAGTDLAADSVELRQVPARNLADEVVQLRS